MSHTSFCINHYETTKHGFQVIKVFKNKLVLIEEKPGYRITYNDQVKGYDRPGIESRHCNRFNPFPKRSARLRGPPYLLFSVQEFSSRAKATEV
jgi:hypothetical protein